MDNKPESPQVASPCVPPDWTEQRDVEWYRQQFESAATNPYVEVLERLWHEHKNLEDSLTGWIGLFLADDEFDPDPVSECLGAAAKAELLLAIIRPQSNEAERVARFEKDLNRVKTALHVCDRVVSRYLLQRKKVWLFEIGTVIEELARGTWLLKDCVRGNFKYLPRQRVEGSQV
jgi:hypothetical protein